MLESIGKTGLQNNSENQDNSQEQSAAEQQMINHRLIKILKKGTAMADIKFVIIEEIGILSEGTKGWKKELNKISWNGAAPKYDINELYTYFHWQTF